MLDQTSFISTCSKNLSGISRQNRDGEASGEDGCLHSLSPDECPLSAAQKLLLYKQFLTCRKVSRIIQRVLLTRASLTQTPQWLTFFALSLCLCGISGNVTAPTPLYPKHDQAYFQKQASLLPETVARLPNWVISFQGFTKAAPPPPPPPKKGVGPLHLSAWQGQRPPCNPSIKMLVEDRLCARSKNTAGMQQQMSAKLATHSTILSAVMRRIKTPKYV